MIQITVNVFSGRPDPQWIPEQSEAERILRTISRNRGMVTEGIPTECILGFQGIQIDLLEDVLAEQYNLPHSFWIATGFGSAEEKGLELAEELLQAIPEEAITPFNDRSPAAEVEAVQGFALEGLETVLLRPNTSTEEAFPPPATQESVEGTGCYIELAPFDSRPWNAPGHVNSNNCYNYATNRRLSTGKAQPGKAAGAMYKAYSCAEVSRAAQADGLKPRGTCLPDGEKNRWFVALVMAPGYDYHWYRKHKEGFWGHKRGYCPAHNVDTNRRVIQNPETCARGKYTEFCGYFYVGKSVRVAA